MQFDWFTFVAQLINFVLLLVLLRRFLFTPIQRAMQRREAAITARVKAAEEQMAAATNAEANWRAQQQAFAAQKAELLATAEAEAHALRREMVQEARVEVNAQQERWYAALHHEQTLFLESLRQQINEQVFAVARRALSDLANLDLEQQIVAVFLQQLHALSDAERGQLHKAIQTADDRVVVRSTFALPEMERQRLQACLEEVSGCPVKLRFSSAPELGCGIALQVDGQRLAWSLHHYLAEAEEHLATTLRADGVEPPPIALADQAVPPLWEGARP